MHALIKSACKLAVKVSPLLLVIGAGSSPPDAQGAITYYRLFKSTSYQQTANAQPSTPDQTWANLDVFSSNASDLNSATVTATSPLSPYSLSLAAPGYAPPFTAYTFTTSYATVSALTTNYPNFTSYSYAISGGVLGSQNASLVSPPSKSVSGYSFLQRHRVQSIAGNEFVLPFTFAWNGFSVGSPVNLQSAYFTINRISDGQVAYSSVQGNGAGSATILKNTLQPNTAYNATLIYDARIENFNAGFNGATSEVAFDQRVNLAFATGAIPEPSSIILAVLGLACVAIWPRRSRMFVLCAVAALCSPRISEAGTIVSFDFTNFGQVQVELFDSDAPLTVANFLTYVTGGRYNDTMIHRVDTGLGVVQGGGFTKTAGPIPTDPAIPLEYSHPNARGTLAMARTSSPNTATSQWYFNTHDNSTLLGPSNGGGYAVFGQVLGSGMDVIDAIFSVPTFAYNQPFSQVPLQNFSTTDFNNGADPIPHVVVLHSVTVVPEPSSFALAAIGLIGWLVLRRRALPAN